MLKLVHYASGESFTVKKASQVLSYFTLFEKCLWLVSVVTVAVCYILSPNGDVFSLIASLIGVTALIFIAKGNVIGQVLIVIFAVFYGIISYSFSYYGEMITYLGMSAPIAVISVITWLKHPYKKNVSNTEAKQSSEVAINSVSARTWAIVGILTAGVTVAFYFILVALETENPVLSTVSVTTSFAAASLSALRSPYYALGYALNDIVLITLWILATVEDISYLPMIICFTVFLVNDSYGFICWQKRKRNQNA